MAISNPPEKSGVTHYYIGDSLGRRAFLALFDFGSPNQVEQNQNRADKPQQEYTEKDYQLNQYFADIHKHLQSDGLIDYESG